MNIIIELREPFYSAYGMYGWENGVEGFGIAVRLLEKALLEKRKLQVRVRDANYIISAKNAIRKADLYHSYYTARDGTQLAVIPRTAFKKLPSEEETIEIPLDVRIKMRDLFRSKVK